MKKLTFVQVQKEKDDHGAFFRAMMRQYTAELDVHRNRHTREKLLSQLTDGMLSMLDPHDRHLELAYLDDTAVGSRMEKSTMWGTRAFSNRNMGTSWSFMWNRPFAARGTGHKWRSALSACLRDMAPKGCI